MTRSDRHKGRGHTAARVNDMLLYVHRNRRFIRNGRAPPTPPAVTHSLVISLANLFPRLIKSRDVPAHHRSCDSLGHVRSRYLVPAPPITSVFRIQNGATQCVHGQYLRAACGLRADEKETEANQVRKTRENFEREFSKKKDARSFTDLGFHISVFVSTRTVHSIN